MSTLENLRRLLSPRHIAFIGGNDADFSARQCAALFDGPVWGVNPKRDTLGGVPCFAAVEDLPEAPDAVFLAEMVLGMLNATITQWLSDPEYPIADQLPRAAHDRANTAATKPLRQVEPVNETSSRKSRTLVAAWRATFVSR